MARAIRLPLRMIYRPDALAEVIAAVALANQPKLPRADGQLTFSRTLQECSQLGDEVRKDVANKRVLHAGRVAGAALFPRTNSSGRSALDRSFWKLFIASATATCADGIAKISLPLLAASLTSSPMLISGLTAFALTVAGLTPPTVG